MKLRLNPLALAIALVLLMFGGIAISDGMNYWVIESTKVPAKFTTGEFEGSYNPADIRGSYSFSDISSNFAVPVEALARAFSLGADENAEAFKCKDLESKYVYAAEKGYEIGTDSVRVFIALYKGLPVELTDTYLPDSAYEVLKEKAKLTPEQQAYLESHTVDLSKLSAGPAEPAKAPEQSKESTAAGQTENGSEENLVLDSK